MCQGNTYTGAAITSDEELGIIQQILTSAMLRLGSVARLAEHLKISYADLAKYRAGDDTPPDEVLLRAVDVILDELPAIRRTCSAKTWQALSLPKVPQG